MYVENFSKLSEEKIKDQLQIRQPDLADNKADFRVIASTGGPALCGLWDLKKIHYTKFALVRL